jgi:hypothetical protein
MPDPTQRLEEIRHEIDRLQTEQSRLSATQTREVRIGQQRFHELLYRYVGFELFDPHQAYLLPAKTYVAQSGRYVLLGFHEQSEADEFFDAAHKVTS